MQKYVIPLLTTGLLFLYTSCGFLTHKASQTPVAEEVPAQPEPTALSTASSFVQLGKQAEQIGDTLGAEYYFNKAMDLAGKFQDDTDSETVDSSSTAELESISLEYARFLSRLNGIENDTLSASNVMEVLNEMEAAIDSNQTDSSLVSIPDVMQNEENMTIPLVLNQKVERAIKYFQSKGRRVFNHWLARSGRYKELITRILKEEGVPEELLYLAMIESGFNPRANSYARAVGIWQFIYSTGKAYGLRNSWWYDERRDPEKSTRAAAQHLKDLYERFNNWYLALAGYNFSPAKIERRLNHYKVDEFWELPKLPRQTRNYVPTFIAAALLAQNPDKYGFDVQPEDPVRFDTVTVNECVDLNVVSDCVDASFEHLKDLNPALLRWCTPPDVDSWVLNIPKGTREQFLKNYSKVDKKDKLTWIHHRIRSGETLSTIARHYGVSMTEIRRFNHIRGSFIRAGHSLVIPVPQNKKYAARLARSTKSSYNYVAPHSTVSHVPGREKTVHVVKKGESLWSISERYNVSLTELRKWNGLSYRSLIKPGQKINVWLPKEIESLFSSSLADKISPAQPSVTNDPPSDDNTIIYTVRDGDTLWDIAARYSVSIRDLKKWNKRRSNIIKAGDQLKIMLNN